jgi:predicted alpha-1,6-mannanase (GH76 family)
MKTKLFKQSILSAVAFSALLISACSDSDLGPLREPVEIEAPAYEWAATADSLQEVTYTSFLVSGGTFRQDNAGNNNFNYWWNAHMLDVLVDGYERTGDESYVPRMKALLNGIRSKNGGRFQNEFIDDMEWLAIASLRAYKATGDADYRNVAEELWNEISKHWSEVHGGGITWKINTPSLKNACSNGPAAILALRLYELDQDTEYLDWAKRIYEWEKNTLVDPATGLVWDHIDIVNGQEFIQKDWIFTYNVGTFLGAANELYLATKERAYLNDAIRTTSSTMISPQLTTEGVLKSEGEGDGGLFKGILVRYMNLLVQNPDLDANKRQDFLRFLKFNAETFYKRGLARPTMMAGPDWRNRPQGKTDLSTQLSGMMLMEAAADLKEAGLLD